MREAFYKEKKIETKECGTDLVTETDQKVEQLIIGSLKEKFPSHRYFYVLPYLLGQYIDN